MGVRPKRVEDALLRAVTEVLQRKVKDPRIVSVTVTSVSVSPDLRNATIFVSSFSSNGRKSLLSGLEASASYIRRETAAIIRIKNMPELRFIYDDGLESGDRVLSILNNLGKNDSSTSSE